MLTQPSNPGPRSMLLHCVILYSTIQHFILVLRSHSIISARPTSQFKQLKVEAPFGCYLKVWPLELVPLLWISLHYLALDMLQDACFLNGGCRIYASD